jgi:N6-adenosine-specific RNA methylase IME4
MGRRPIGRKAMTPAQRAKAYRDRKRPNPTRLKQERRAERERELAARTIAAAEALGAAGKLYGVLYADPPWDWETWSEKGMSRAPGYPTMTLDAIKALKVPAAPDCVLLMWATVPMLPQALEVMAAWGFTYRSHFVWLKDKSGTGYWNRNRHELLLVGTRGNVPAPAPGEQIDSVLEAPRGAHSEKPEIFQALVEAMFPHTPKLELFARGGPVSWWDRWGNEAETVGDGATASEAATLPEPRP